MTRIEIVAMQVRAQLAKIGTPVPPVAATDDLRRRQLAVWLPMLRFAPPTKVRHAPVLVIPVKEEEDDGERPKRS